MKKQKLFYAFGVALVTYSFIQDPNLIPLAVGLVFMLYRKESG